jgi:3-deoxy-manno-octulosonate cytidylyltransferase (CMP-KDO synthetase)
MAATRLPGKPLADLGGAPLIVHVWRRAMEAAVGPVAVACADAEIAEAVTAAGGRAVLTRAHHASGSDRIFEALQAIDPKQAFDAVVNLPGDLPTIDPGTIRAVLEPLRVGQVDIATLAFEITQPEERDDPNVVKAVISLDEGGRHGRALYFSRAAVPFGDGPFYHHVGLYAYRRPALARFVKLPQGALERRERLEQLRALEAGLRIDVALVDRVPPAVDTPADLERVRAMLRS